MRTSVSHPNREIESVSPIQMDKGGEPVMAVDDVDSSPASRNADDWEREFVGLTNEGCTCPKPLNSVLQVCRWCLLTARTRPDYPPNTGVGFFGKQVLSKCEIKKRPLSVHPKAEWVIAKESVPWRTAQ